ncbi:uncharacterized protein LOC143283823 [Babylonia areolata]|uniref:uncharacterized protein LOC143283823 n=1 Tax=Babylonia areolata TaxID=304850 RepID=UPI003FD10086
MGAKTSRQPTPLGGGSEGGGRGGGAAAAAGGGGGGGGGLCSHPSDSSSSPRPTPYIEAPYVGPWAEYRFADVTVSVESDVTFSFCDLSMTSVRSASAVPALSELYGQGYSLVTFCRLPWGHGGGGGGQKKVFSAGRELRYQGVFCRYEGDPGNDGWNLRAEKSILHTHHVTPGVVSAEEGPGAQHIQQLISNTVQTGGRLLTVQWSGQPQHSAADAGFGVDVFFEVPVQPLPERSVYQLVSATATLVRRSLFTSKCHVTCDWAGILTRHLARGWRLVDIFCEVPSTGSALSPASSKLHTVWFFEKPESRARDDSAVYEGRVVEHWVDVTGGSSSSSSLISGRASGCLGGGRGHGKRGGGGSGGKKTSSRRLASVRKKGEEGASSEQLKVDLPDADADRESDSSWEKRGHHHHHHHHHHQQQHSPHHHNADTCTPHRKAPTEGRSLTDSAGWEGVIRSMGEKGWELACMVNTLDCQLVSGQPRVKVLLVFQRRISLLMSVKGRRTSDALRGDSGPGSSAVVGGDMAMLTGETSSHLNPSLAVRLPLSRTASREHDDFQGGCVVDDDVPSTIGGPPCSRTASTSELSTAGRPPHDSGLLEPGRGSRRGREERLLQPRTSSVQGDGEGSVGTGGRSSTSSQHSRVTAAEVHTPLTGEESSSEDGKRRVGGSGGGGGGGGKKLPENPPAPPPPPPPRGNVRETEKPGHEDKNNVKRNTDMSVAAATQELTEHTHTAAMAQHAKETTGEIEDPSRKDATCNSSADQTDALSTTRGTSEAVPPELTTTQEPETAANKAEAASQDTQPTILSFVGQTESTTMETSAKKGKL